jgi:hypothetical protein
MSDTTCRQNLGFIYFIMLWVSGTFPEGTAASARNLTTPVPRLTYVKLYLRFPIHLMAWCLNTGTALLLLLFFSPVIASGCCASESFLPHALRRVFSNCIGTAQNNRKSLDEHPRLERLRSRDSRSKKPTTIHIKAETRMTFYQFFCQQQTGRPDIAV